MDFAAFDFTLLESSLWQGPQTPSRSIMSSICRRGINFINYEKLKLFSLFMASALTGESCSLLPPTLHSVKHGFHAFNHDHRGWFMESHSVIFTQSKCSLSCAHRRRQEWKKRSPFECNSDFLRRSTATSSISTASICRAKHNKLKRSIFSRRRILQQTIRGKSWGKWG